MYSIVALIFKLECCVLMCQNSFKKSKYIIYLSLPILQSHQRILSSVFNKDCKDSFSKTIKIGTNYIPSFLFSIN